MKTSTQLKALIRNMSISKNIEPEILLRTYMLERFLERISLSEFSNNFILKGGMLIASLVGIDTRATMDMDTTIKGLSLSLQDIEKTIINLLTSPIDDGVIMTFKSIEEIREDAEYSGVRVSIEAILDKTRQILKIDITTGDLITPKEIDYSFKLMFEDRDILIKAYNLETVLAEKIETIISRGTTNTRMRDFYDVHILTLLQSSNIDTEVFKIALENTAVKRGTHLVIAANGLNIIKGLRNSEFMLSLWSRYRIKNNYANSIEWNAVISSIEILLKQAKIIIE
jgi:predicted nucleotidyltransferase component of viral defense system